MVSEDEIKEYYIEALKLQLDMLINYLVKQIKLYDDKITIVYNASLKPSKEVYLKTITSPMTTQMVAEQPFIQPNLI